MALQHRQRNHYGLRVAASARRAAALAVCVSSAGSEPAALRPGERRRGETGEPARRLRPSSSESLRAKPTSVNPSPSGSGEAGCPRVGRATPASAGGGTASGARKSSSAPPAIETPRLAAAGAASAVSYTHLTLPTICSV